jgi:hypothetical protein
LGTALLTRLQGVATAEKIHVLKGDILHENRGMQAVCRKRGFDVKYDVDEGVVKVSYRASAPAS